MRIAVGHQGESHVVESGEPISINDLLTKLGIHPSTVLAVHDGTIVPHTTMISQDVEIELVVVSSGG
ncbi:MAG: hypothetical protein CMA79_01900 [Euryarchaeota archaeon]|nr:hypothetical protein [Euryarchaeota archaeon]MEC9458042.1 MoaD/ThiS family protein [Candidatus Thermoplasmatota archaeon]MEE2629775.1 MoaD/ThiS family protein [Candidatus Thermoplasmatota archaeon]